ncbi:hypothetical protein [Naasia lichenicola]|uniref:Uncharacterized protein n=1 Tax=Naasia lichenicola TaxID=2565933 RepID=A0A4S4FUF0_9MICO|nr:hypothetical protein [Naasia lichenicola]THG33445.1 hypothetical protein E6C64_03655 [Naasia lichenicola]
MLFEADVPEGHHFGVSRTVDGGVVGGIYSDITHKLVDQAVFMPVYSASPSERIASAPGTASNSAPRLSPMQQQIAVAITQALVQEIVRQVTPLIVQWMTDKGIPKIKEAWARAIKRPATEAESAKPQAAVEPAMFIASSTGVEVAISEAKVTMSRAEWDERFRLMVRTAEFSEQQRRILEKAEIVEEGNVLEAKPTDQLTPKQFQDSVMQILESNPSLLDEHSAGEWIRIIAQSQKPDDDGSAAALV